MTCIEAAIVLLPIWLGFPIAAWALWDQRPR